jgi:hypothetical protein
MAKRSDALHCIRDTSRSLRKASTAAIAAGFAVAVALLALPALPDTMGRKQYWATSLSDGVDAALLLELYAAVRRGEVGWVDTDPAEVPRLEPGINLILYHVGGNCYIGSDCDRFPASEPSGDQWSNKERAIDLKDPAARRIVIEDLVALAQQADRMAPSGSIVGVHLDNVHRLDAQGLAGVFNDFLRAVDAAKERGVIRKARKVGYVAKNNPDAFRAALEGGMLEARPLYQINENASLDEDEALDRESRAAQEIGRRYCIPVFLKTFGTDVAYTIEQDDFRMKVYVSQEMTKRMALLPNISGAAWSAQEIRYRPTLFAQGSPVAVCN